jgi:cytoskeletal protein CcmA (bactofilin family)
MAFLRRLMLSRAKPAQPQQTAGMTYLDKGSLITGNLNTNGHLRLDGAIKGNVSVKGMLEVSAGASIDGEMLEVESLLLHGSIKANVTARGKITISKTGRLIGDVKATSLDIETGAVFSGRSEMNAAAMTSQLDPSRGIPEAEAKKAAGKA